MLKWSSLLKLWFSWYFVRPLLMSWTSVAIIVRLKRAPESRMHQNAPFRRRTCLILFCPGPTPTGEGPSPDFTPLVPLHLIAFSTWPPDHISGYGLATRGQILQKKCNKFDFGCGSAPYPAGVAYAGASFEGATALLPPPSKAKQKIICSAKLPHTRRHILANVNKSLLLSIACFYLF